MSDHQGHVPDDYMLCPNDACTVHGLSRAKAPVNATASGMPPHPVCPSCGHGLQSSAAEPDAADDDE